jgi:hypothetical protein
VAPRLKNYSCEWLKMHDKAKVTTIIKESVNYARKYVAVLDTCTMPNAYDRLPWNKYHAITTLANQANSQGVMMDDKNSSFKNFITQLQ